MYKHGDLKITPRRGPDCDEWCEFLHSHIISDSRSKDDADYYHGPGTAYLPHSCDYWVIGGPDQIRAMIADLQAVLVAIESTKGEGET